MDTINKEKDILKRDCPRCSTSTNQRTVFNEGCFKPSEFFFRNKEGNETEKAYLVQGEIWRIYKCLGCDTLNLQFEIVHVPNLKPVSIFLFPKGKQIRSMPEWVARIKIEYLEQFQEIYQAINEGLFRLALMGIRALLDQFIVEKVGDIGTFKDKLNKLREQGYVTERKIEVLDTALDAGNAATHRGFKPDEDTIGRVMEILENIMQTEIIERDHTKVKEKIPSRPKRAK